MKTPIRITEEAKTKILLAIAGVQVQFMTLYGTTDDPAAEEFYMQQLKRLLDMTADVEKLAIIPKTTFSIN